MIEQKIEQLKKELRNLVELQKTKDVKEYYRGIAKNKNPSLLPEHRKYFASNPSEIDPEKMKIELIICETDEQKKLFRSAMSFLEMPVGSGYGKRIRAIIFDSYHNKVAGIAGLMDSIINLSARDRLIGWDKELRHQKLYHIMTAYIIEAMPFYKTLLVDKLVAMIAGSKEIVQHFQQKYRDTTTKIRKRQPVPELVAIDTMDITPPVQNVSGNIKLDEWNFAGYTGEYMYLPDDVWNLIYDIARDLKLKVLKQNRYGDGAHHRTRVLESVLRHAGISREMVRTNYKKAYYLRPLAENWREFLLWQTDSVNYVNKTVDEYFEIWKEKWLKSAMNKFVF